MNGFQQVVCFHFFKDILSMSGNAAENVANER